MFAHISVGTDDVARAREIYDPAMEVLGLKPWAEYGAFAVSYGSAKQAFWVQLPDDKKTATRGNGSHVCFSASTRKMVHDFYEAALKGGASDDGAPGLRPQYTPTYYGAFFKDHTGNKIEVVCHNSE